jgi:hypothetical protein
MPCRVLTALVPFTEERDFGWIFLDGGLWARGFWAPRVGEQKGQRETSF